ncbi:MAG: hypothetical protein KDA28_17665, partial [Phycisphaerales bacterium]|nr:hypothetical protein [Phycisphaerales bacterium]
LVGGALGLIKNQPVGLTFSSNVGVSVVANELQLGEANATGASTSAGTGWFFGDAFINKDLAGEMYFETLNFYNPTPDDITVTIELLFSTSDIESFTVNVDAGGFAEVLLHDHPSILNRDTQLNFFSISASADVPFVTSLVHYDLFLDGGWGNSGSSIGLLNPISTII